MKKILACAMSVALLGGAMVAFSACTTESDLKDGTWLPSLEVYAPDGAPALSLVNAIAKDGANEKNTFDFHVVDANTITSYVAGASPKADVAVLPVNAAAKVLGQATTYQLLGTVTNGNLYFLTTGENPRMISSESSHRHPHCEAFPLPDLRIWESSQLRDITA